MRVTIVGSGFVGATTAMRVVQKRLADDVVLVDIIDGLPQGLAINASTGVVTVANGALLDFETATSHSITAQVSDGTLTSSQTFSIAVTDVAPSTPADNTDHGTGPHIAVMAAQACAVPG